MHYLQLFSFLLICFPLFSQEHEVFTIIEEQPSFPGCDDLKDKTERHKCSDKKMVQFLAMNAGYPSEAREAGFEGTVFIRFIVEPDGSITNIEVLKDQTPGGGLKEAALMAVQAMNDMPQKWKPGRKDGEAVRVRVVVPVKFKLMDEEDFSQEELAPEEPSFSIETNYKPSKSTQKLICGIWKIESLNGKKVTENGTFEFKKNKDIIMTAKGELVYSAKWKLHKDGNKIIMYDPTDMSNEISGIVALDKDKFILINRITGRMETKRIKNK